MMIVNEICVVGCLVSKEVKNDLRMNNVVQLRVVYFISKCLYICSFKNCSKNFTRIIWTTSLDGHVPTIFSVLN